MNAQSTIRAWGNSQGLLIPKDILKTLSWKSADALELETRGDELVIRKKFVHKTFEERLAEYDGQIEVYDFDWGQPEGREML